MGRDRARRQEALRYCRQWRSGSRFWTSTHDFHSCEFHSVTTSTPISNFHFHYFLLYSVNLGHMTFHCSASLKTWGDVKLFAFLSCLFPISFWGTQSLRPINLASVYHDLAINFIRQAVHRFTVSQSFRRSIFLLSRVFTMTSYMSKSYRNYLC